MSIIDKLMEKDLGTLKETAKEDIEITRLSEAFGEPFIVTVKELSYKRIQDLKMLSTDKKGGLDETEFVEMLVTDGIVSPDFNNKELLQKFKVASKQALMAKLFKAGELENIGKLITSLSGFDVGSIKKVANEVKN